MMATSEDSLFQHAFCLILSLDVTLTYISIRKHDMIVLKQEYFKIIPSHRISCNEFFLPLAMMAGTRLALQGATTPVTFRHFRTTSRLESQFRPGQCQPFDRPIRQRR